MRTRILSLRHAKGWTQSELADRAGVTRQLVSALEAGRHQPGVVAALGLARALGATVEELFGPGPRDQPLAVLDEAIPPGAPVVTATVGDRLVAVEARDAATGSESWDLADARFAPTGLDWLPDAERHGLVIAGCDPALGLLARLAERAGAGRIVAVHAPSRRAIDALADGRAHAALVHGPPDTLPAAPAGTARWHVARWQVGLAGRDPKGPPTLDELAERRGRIVQRDDDAAAQRTLRRALRAVGAEGPLPGPRGSGHLDVARRVRHGGTARAGLTMEPAAAALGLGFRALEAHVVELWVDERFTALPAAAALVELLGSGTLRDRLDLLPGYDLAGAGTRRGTR